MKVFKDLSVVVGEYTDKNGEVKPRREKIGVKIEDGDKEYILLKKTFNPAGISGDSENVLVSIFKQRENTTSEKSKPQSFDNLDDLDDEIPF